MADPKLRRRITARAAQLMYERQESEYFTAKRKAAREMGLDPKYRPHDLPSNAEIREELSKLADLYEGQKRYERLQKMRIAALWLMRKLADDRPRLIGSVWTGHTREGSDIDIHVFADGLTGITTTLEEEGLDYQVEEKRIVKHNEQRHFTHVHAQGPGGVSYELTVYPADKASYPFKSSITGKTIEGGRIADLEALLRQSQSGLDLEEELDKLEHHADAYALYRLLLQPLENVKQSPKYHPEGDALYHSLQVFELARRERPWDYELQLAALLHDVGKAIEPRDHVQAALEALEGVVSDRAAWLIGHHMEAHAEREGTLGKRAARRLRQADDYEDLLLLSELDEAGRVPGAEVPSLEEALNHLRRMEEQIG
jgi:predicted nucleotidyltransferase